jgi:hypothetical protein
MRDEVLQRKDDANATAHACIAAFTHIDGIVSNLLLSSHSSSSSSLISSASGGALRRPNLGRARTLVLRAVSNARRYLPPSNKTGLEFHSGLTLGVNYGPKHFTCAQLNNFGRRRPYRVAADVQTGQNRAQPAEFVGQSLDLISRQIQLRQTPALA